VSSYRIVLVRRGAPFVTLEYMSEREDALLYAAWKALEFESAGLPNGESVTSKVRQANGDWQLRVVGGAHAYVRVLRQVEEHE
jgi:hypothetical protein